MKDVTVAGNARSPDRRRCQRVSLSASVQFGRSWRRKGSSPHLYTGDTADLSPTGVYIITGTEGRFVPGELLSVSVSVPVEARSAFPFSQMSGYGRVVRLERLSTASGPRQRGLALALCEDQLTLLGAMTDPVLPRPLDHDGARRR